MPCLRLGGLGALLHMPASFVQGLWVLQAPGEAEAMCAALDRAGHVDACATSDGDALLFGAQTLFHTMKPVVSPPQPRPLFCL